MIEDVGRLVVLVAGLLVVVAELAAVVCPVCSVVACPALVEVVGRVGAAELVGWVVGRVLEVVGRLVLVTTPDTSASSVT